MSQVITRNMKFNFLEVHARLHYTSNDLSTHQTQLTMISEYYWHEKHALIINQNHCTIILNVIRYIQL